MFLFSFAEPSGSNEKEVAICLKAHRLRAPNNNWKRTYGYQANATNQLASTTLGGITTNYQYDLRGNMIGLPHLQAMEWNETEELTAVQLNTNDQAYYRYSGGQRVRKVLEKSNKGEERLYLGGVERYREYSSSGTVALERWTLLVEGIAQFDTLTVDNGQAVVGAVPTIRYQYRDHLGSSTVEADEDGKVISYEEYYPYGASAYRASSSSADLSLKRYRFTGKERDEETGLDYFGVRYYASWLGRWTSGDPGGFVDGINLYRYVRNNPVNGVDRKGYSTETTTVSQDSYSYYQEDSTLFYQISQQQPQQETDPPKSGPVVENGVLVGYILKEGQGFTHVANDVNDPETQKKYGYKLSAPIDWKEIAFQFDNLERYVLPELEQGNIMLPEIVSPWHEAWTSMNMNEGDPLVIDVSRTSVVVINTVKEPSSISFSPDPIASFFDIVGGAGAGFSQMGGKFRWTSGALYGRKFSFKHYPSGWGGGSRARITTYSSSNTGKILGRIGTVGTLAYGAYNIGDSYIEEGGFGTRTKQVTGNVVGGLGGGALGSSIGAGIGSFFGGVGAIPGGIIGGFVGGWFGGIGGEKAVREVQEWSGIEP